MSPKFNAGNLCEAIDDEEKYYNIDESQLQESYGL
jgi:hypothetical protein